MATVDLRGAHERDVWHILHEHVNAQARLERQAAALREQAATMAREAVSVAAGKRPVAALPRRRGGPRHDGQRRRQPLLATC
jgi:hypothetical protein